MRSHPSSFRHRTVLLAVAGALAIAGLAFLAMRNAEEASTPPANAEAASKQAEPDFHVLVGPWIRPDGGYVITIRSVDADGNLDAAYANPSPLPFQRANASLDGETISVFLELTAGGYNGSTYTLTYDPKEDLLKGIYYQAVAKQRYDVYFERQK